MILAVDIGNTTVSIALMKSLKVFRAWSLDSTLSEFKFNHSLRKMFEFIQKKYPAIEGGMICSVVPRLTGRTKNQFKKIFLCPVLVVGKDIHVPIKNNYQPAKQVGQDRLVGAYAAKCLYKAPCVIVDFGTAITFDVINAKGEYEGGMIVPGIRLSIESLFSKTALLPRLEKIQAPKQLIGKNTKQSILSGIFFGYGAMCSGLIGLIVKKVKGKSKIVVTGGYTRLMKKFIIHQIDHIDEHLVFKGMALIFSSIKK